MTPRQKLFAIILSIALVVIIIELVRRKKLREEFSWLWILASVTILILGIWDGILTRITHLMGIIYNVSTIFFSAVVFLFAIILHFSVKMSGMTNKIKTLAQEIALLKEKTQQHS